MYGSPPAGLPCVTHTFALGLHSLLEKQLLVLIVQAEAWLASREGLLLDPNCGVSQGPTVDRLRDGSCGQGQVLVLLCSLNSHARLWTGRVRLLVPRGAGPHPDLLLPSTRWPMWSCCSMDTMT